MFPKDLISVTNKKKQRKFRSTEKKLSKQGTGRKPFIPTRLPPAGLGMKPTWYKYVWNKAPKLKVLGQDPSYPYNWFIGGVDTCYGDSGGPLWSNVQVARIAGT